MGERLRWFCLSGFGRYEEERFKAEVLSGHKEDAIEVPFDPALEWGISPKSLWRGRRGHLVNASVNGLSFASSIVPRQKKFYLLINAEAAKSGRISEGGVVEVAVKPC